LPLFASLVGNDYTSKDLQQLRRALGLTTANSQTVVKVVAQYLANQIQQRRTIEETIQKVVSGLPSLERGNSFINFPAF
jgi:hypothetical protein